MADEFLELMRFYRETAPEDASRINDKRERLGLRPISADELIALRSEMLAAIGRDEAVNWSAYLDRLYSAPYPSSAPVPHTIRI